MKKGARGPGKSGEESYPPPIDHDFRINMVGITTLFNLVKLFKDFEKKEFSPKDLLLEQDIKKSINTILRIEDLESKRRKFDKKKSELILSDQAYRSYLQTYINDLDKVLNRIPIYVGVCFEAFFHALPSLSSLKKDAIKTTQERRAFVDNSFNKMYKNLDKLALKKNLSALRFYPHTLIHGVQFDDRQARVCLTNGLFFYAQKLIHGSFSRPRKCSNCSEWFFAERRNHIYCNPQCEDVQYRKTTEYKEKNKRASKKYRFREKFPHLSSPKLK